VIVTMMREGEDPETAVPPAEAIGYAKEYVVRGLELSLMQRAYRTGQGAFSGIVLERLRAATDDADLLAKTMSFINDWIFAWVEAIERRLTDVYLSEHAQWLRGADAVRAAEVRALLRGGTGDAGELFAEMERPGRRRWESRASSPVTARRCWRGGSRGCAGTVTAPSPPTRTSPWRRSSPTTPRRRGASPRASSARSPAVTTRP
jgi:hypothetical protein